MRKFVCIGYFRDFPRLYFANVGSIEESVETGIKDIRDVKNTKVGWISRERCLDKTFWYLRLSQVSSEIFFVSLL